MLKCLSDLKIKKNFHNSPINATFLGDCRDCIPNSGLLCKFLCKMILKHKTTVKCT